jgi:glycosyltransferase involved in cell wall biosynthesis
MKIIIIAFNFEFIKGIANGPGESLKNFYNIIKDTFEVHIFTEVNSKETFVKSINDLNVKMINQNDIIIFWSGLTDRLFNVVKKINIINNNIILGPNLIDTVNYDKEKYFLSNINYMKILTVNNRLKYLISKKHSIDINKINIFCVGPNIDLWKPIKEKDNTILWKGNSRHFVKDVDFALQLKNKLTEFNFKFIGYPNTYDYINHIYDAKKSKIYISTSLSETMGLTLIESWASGIPSITHPLIYLHGENYKTGIITNKTIDAYSDAIKEIMYNDILYKDMSSYCEQYAIENFSNNVILENFMEIINVR